MHTLTLLHAEGTSRARVEHSIRAQLWNLQTSGVRLQEQPFRRYRVYVKEPTICALAPHHDPTYLPKPTPPASVLARWERPQHAAGVLAPPQHPHAQEPWICWLPCNVAAGAIRIRIPDGPVVQSQLASPHFLRAQPKSSRASTEAPGGPDVIWRLGWRRDEVVLEIARSQREKRET